MAGPGRNVMETDPFMTRSLRSDFSATVEAAVADGSVRDGRPAVGDLGAVVFILLAVLGFAILVGLAVNWNRLFP